MKWAVFSFTIHVSNVWLAVQQGGQTVGSVIKVLIFTIAPTLWWFLPRTQGGLFDDMDKPKPKAVEEAPEPEEEEEPIKGGYILWHFIMVVDFSQS